MDLRKLMNDAASQPPRLETSQSSYDSRTANVHDPQNGRPSSYPPSLQSSDLRSQSVYVDHQSPHHANLNSASTSAGTHSVYAQSPNTLSQPYNQRENTGSHYYHNNNNNSAPSHSPVASAHQPPTPTGAQQYQNHNSGSSYHQQVQQASYIKSQSPQTAILSNGPGSIQSRQISPHAQLHHQPSTPLGPPISYNRISPQAQRPPSQGIDQHHRKSSYGSVSSGQSREHNHNQPSSESARAQNLQRQVYGEVDQTRDRDRSISVSPKTIPKPSPYRQLSSNSTNSTPHRSTHSPHESKPISIVSISHEHQSEMSQHSLTPKVLATSLDHRNPPQALPVSSSSPHAFSNLPITRPMNSPGSAHREIPPNVSQSNLKRNASVMSDLSATTQQPRKRLRGESIPVWARSARRKPPKFGNGSKKARFATNQSIQIQKASTPASTNGQQLITQQPVSAEGTKVENWEPTIANRVPGDDLCSGISRWIHSHIVNKIPPQGAVFEIEAKVGAIWDTQLGERKRLPIRSEAIVEPGLSHTKFESSMDMEQHKQLNQYLNNLTQETYQNSNREPIRFAHLKQYDDFYDLTPEGLQHLNQALLSNINSRSTRRPRVRKTTNLDTGEIQAMIVKTRIDDLEVYNPVHDFDFRISISVEANWEGDPAWLIPMQNNNARTRQKDRMSYRHGAIQVDLTQVSHEDSQHMEHELEVEVSVAMLQVELEKERMGQKSRFYDLVKSLVDNTRLLCRQGSLYR